MMNLMIRNWQRSSCKTTSKGFLGEEFYGLLSGPLKVHAGRDSGSNQQDCKDDLQSTEETTLGSDMYAMHRRDTFTCQI